MKVFWRFEHCFHTARKHSPPCIVCVCVLYKCLEQVFFRVFRELTDFLKCAMEVLPKICSLCPLKIPVSACFYTCVWCLKTDFAEPQTPSPNLVKATTKLPLRTNIQVIRWYWWSSFNSQCFCLQMKCVGWITKMFGSGIQVITLVIIWCFIYCSSIRWKAVQPQLYFVFSAI